MNSIVDIPQTVTSRSINLHHRTSNQITVKPYFPTDIKSNLHFRSEMQINGHVTLWSSGAQSGAGGVNEACVVACSQSIFFLVCPLSFRSHGRSHVEQNIVARSRLNRA